MCSEWTARKWARRTGGFRNWVTLGLQPTKRHENPRQPHNAAWSGEIELTSGVVEADHLFDPERE